MRQTVGIACLLAMLQTPRALLAQTTRPGATASDPLAARQQIVRDRLAQLEDRMFRLAEKLNQTEPKQAKRLEQALRQSGELLVRNHMDQAIQLLDQADLAQAVEHQVAAEKALDQILKLLTEAGDESRERKDEVDRMKELRERVDKLLDRQLELRSRTDPADRLADQMAAAAAKLQALIGRQSRQNADARRLANADKPDKAQSADLARDQADIREKTDALVRELSETSRAAATQPATGTQPASNPLAHLTEESREHLQNAADQMDQAEHALGDGNPQAAQPKQSKALSLLNKALASLKKQQQSAQPLASKEAAGQQRDLQASAGQLAEAMEDKQPSDSQEGSPKGGQPGGSGEQQPPASQPAKSPQAQPPTPGAGNVRKAQQSMKSAADKLDKGKPSDATQDQDKAIEQLEKAKAELQESLDQLRREQQEEMLASLEQRFRTMLLEQKGINTSTEDMDKRKAQWIRGDSLALAGLSEKQKTLSGEAGKAIEILTADGTSVVFPEILVQIRDDMLDVSRRLGEKQTGTVTRDIQAGILSALQELVDAVEKRRKDGPPPQQQGGGGQGGAEDQNPLLPGSAELKLLRSCQLRINRQTHELQAAATQPAADVGNQSQRLSTRQEQLADMARKINERAGGH